MKKHGLFKILGIIMFIMVILSYFLKGRGGEFNYIGLGDVFLNGLQSMYYLYILHKEKQDFYLYLLLEDFMVY